MLSSGALPLAAILGAMVPLGALALSLTRQGRLRLAGRLLVAGLYLLLTLNAWLADAPGPLAPRSAHHWLLLLGVGACLLLRHERPWLRHGAPLGCLLTYAALASTYEAPALAAEFAPRGQAQVLAAWSDSLLASVLLYVVLLVMQSDARSGGRRERELRDAILRGQLHLHLQPQVNDRGHVVAAEALVRWHHPQRGLIPPAEFIPLPEETGLIVPLGEWVLDRACGQLAHWGARPATAALSLAVNVSAAHFAQADFVERAAAVMQRHAIDPARLKLEITESVLALGTEQVVDGMRALRALGARLSLDDFGTGYSSLAAPRQLPLHKLKIDQSFVRTMALGGKDLAIVQTILDMAYAL